MRELRSLNTHLLRRILVAIALSSVVAMLFGAVSARGPLTSAAAAFFALATSVVAVMSNFEAWRVPPARDARASARLALTTLSNNAALMAIAYGWGAVAMQSLYLTPLTGLRWQHAWQYALAMALLCGASVAIVRALQPPPASGANPAAWRKLLGAARPLALLQGAIAISGLGFLGLSGKLAQQRADWAANRVFAALAVAVIAVSIASLVSGSRSAPTR